MKTMILAALAAILFQTSQLALMVWDRMSLLQSPTEIVLQSAPVDPRDLFRGNYVRLTFPVANIDTKTVALPTELTRKQPIFLVMQQGENEYWVVNSIHTDHPMTADTVVLKATNGYFTITDGKHSSGHMRIELPIARYYAPQTRALDLEKYQSNAALGVVLAVDTNGNAAIKGLRINGETIYEETLF